VQAHGYTVWGYNENTRMVQLRNPHGIGEFRQWFRNLDQVPPDGIDDGIFEMPLPLFRTLFLSIQFEL